MKHTLGFDTIEEHYSLQEMMAAAWRMADLTGEAECLFQYRHKWQENGTPIYGFCSGKQADADNSWRANWELIGVRDPAIWLKHRPEFRLRQPVSQP